MNTRAQTRQGPVEYRIVGQGPVILALNGGHTNCHSPLGHEQFFLDQGYQLLIPSRPGYGKTPSSTGRTAEAFADALVSLLDLLQLDSVIVVGISDAGPTALQLADREGENRGLGISAIAFKVITSDPGGPFLLENTFLATGGPARHLHYDQEEWLYALPQMQHTVRFVLGLKGTMSEAELFVLRARRPRGYSKLCTAWSPQTYLADWLVLHAIRDTIVLDPKGPRASHHSRGLSQL